MQFDEEGIGDDNFPRVTDTLKLKKRFDRKKGKYFGKNDRGQVHQEGKLRRKY